MFSSQDKIILVIYTLKLITSNDRLFAEYYCTLGSMFTHSFKVLRENTRI